MSGFRETFTRGEKENVLGYDDSASLYFAGCILFCVLLPWTFFFVKRLIWPSSSARSSGDHLRKSCPCTSCRILKEERFKKELSWSSMISISFVTQLLLLSILWSCCINIGVRLSQTVTIAAFDPFEILGIASSAPTKDIRRAYRTLSLRHHPDKAKDDPDSAAKFILISKAYQALTDDVARANYEKYGNPDGPGTMKIGIGLPHFLIAKEYQLFILLFFFAILLGVIPGIFVLYYRRQKKYAPNGVFLETIHLLGCNMKEQSRHRQLSELLAASAESRELTTVRPSDNKDMAPIISSVEDGGSRRQFTNSPLVARNQFLILAHFQRLHHLLSPALRAALDILLESSDLITESMMEIAYIRGWTLTLQAVMDFRRCLIQGLENMSSSSSLLQIPHFNPSVVKHCLKGKNAVKDLRGFIAQSPEERKGLADMTETWKEDVAAFCMHVPLMTMAVSVRVSDEKDIVEGDVVTVTVKMTRLNLKEGETAGSIHAPLFPKDKHEEWWIFLIEKYTGTFVSFVRSKNDEREFEERMQFQITKRGKQVYYVSAMCDSYGGLDISTEFVIQVLSEDQADRNIIVHPDDEALDNQPTLFHQMLGATDELESSDDEDGNDRDGLHED